MHTAMILFLSVRAGAEIVDNGRFTSDTVTNLDWLDLTETRGLSYSYVSSQLASDGQFAGWVYATRQQVNDLLINAGIFKKIKMSPNPEAVTNLLNLWGVLNLRRDKELGDGSRFFYGSAFSSDILKIKNNRAYVGSIGKVGKVGNERGLIILNVVQTSHSVNETNERIGSALVRKSINLKQ